MKKNYLFFLTVIFCLNSFGQMLPPYIPTNGLVAFWPFTGNANDESGNGNNGTVNGAILTNDRNGVANSAYFFQGWCVGQYIQATVNTSSIQTGLTISVWVMKEGNGCNGYGPRILEFWPGNNGPGISQWTWDNSNQTVFGSVTSTSVNVTTNFIPKPLNIWTHLVYTNDGAFGKFYQDGSLINTIASSGNPVLAGDVSFGRMNHPAYDAFNGSLDDIGIWNRALDSNEVLQIYQGIPSVTTQFCLDTPTYYSVGVNPSSIASGDFNGDGNKDMIVGNTGYVSVFLGNGLGGFGVANTYTLSSNPTAIIVNDLNNDTKLDLVISAGNNVFTMLGLGNGTFNAASVHPVVPPIGSICTADFNGDGQLDLAGAAPTADSISIFMGNGTGVFGSATNFPVGTCPCGRSCIKAADLNGDTKIDLAVANKNSNDVSILTGDGTGNFALATSFTVGTAPYAIITADFDGDTLIDLAVANRSSNNISIFLGNGSGNFSTGTNISVGAGPVMLIYSDFDGDNKLDIATADRDGSNITLLHGNGTGWFGTLSTFSVVNSPWAFCSDDFNGDNRMDIATANNLSNNAAVLLNCNQNVFTLNVSEPLNKNEFFIYPNPTNNFIFIKADKKISGQKYFVIDSFGRQVLSGHFSNENSGIDLNSLATGIYFLQIGGQQEKTVKIFKN